MKYMLDTNVLVHLIRNKSENVKNRLRQENISDVYFIHHICGA